MRVLVIGAGIGGLTAALALGQRGIEVTVLEGSPHLREEGGGIQLASNGSRALISLGLEDALRQVSTFATARYLRLWNTGMQLQVAELGNSAETAYGAPYLMLQRSDLQRALYAALNEVQPNAVRFGCKAIHCFQSSNSASVVLSTGDQLAADVVIGADGVRSNIRQAHGGATNMAAINLLAWRATVPRELVTRLEILPGITRWVGPGAHVVYYPIRQSTLLNVVAVTRAPYFEELSMARSDEREECLRSFKHWHPDLVHLLKNIREFHRTPLITAKPLQQWSDGRISLLGDAAHPTLPFMAQGACMAIEDAIVLARCLHEVSDPVAALKSYERARLERTSLVMEESEKNGRRVQSHLLADEKEAQVYIDKEWASAAQLQRYAWLYKYDAQEIVLH